MLAKDLLMLISQIDLELVSKNSYSWETLINHIWPKQPGILWENFNKVMIKSMLLYSWGIMPMNSGKTMES